MWLSKTIAVAHGKSTTKDSCVFADMLSTDTVWPHDWVATMPTQDIPPL